MPNVLPFPDAPARMPLTGVFQRRRRLLVKSALVRAAFRIRMQKLVFASHAAKCPRTEAQRMNEAQRSASTTDYFFSLPDLLILV